MPRNKKHKVGNSGTGAKRMTVELWTLVFDHLIRDFCPEEDFTPDNVERVGQRGETRRLPSDPNQVQDLRLVHRAFNKIIVDHAPFWNKIHIPFPISTILLADQLTEHFETIVQRGRGLQSVTLNISIYADFRSRGFRSLPASKGRGIRPAFYSGKEFVKSYDAMEHLMEAITSLVMRGYDRFRVQPIIRSSLPRLRQLELIGVHFEATKRDYQLAKVPSSLFDILLLAPLLEVVILIQVEKWYDSKRAINLPASDLAALVPKLHTIKHTHNLLDCYDVLMLIEDLDLPCPLTVELSGNLLILDQPEYHEMINDVLDRVQSVVLQPSSLFGDPDLNILTWFRNVELLEIANPSTTTLDVSRILDRLVVMAGRITGSQGHLNELTLKHCTASLYDLEDFLRGWRWRTTDNKKLDLQDCTIRFGIKPERKRAVNLARAAIAGIAILDKARSDHNILLVQNNITWSPRRGGKPLKF